MHATKVHEKPPVFFFLALFRVDVLARCADRTDSNRGRPWPVGGFLLTQYGLVIFVVAQTRCVVGWVRVAPKWCQLPTLRCMPVNDVTIVEVGGRDGLQNEDAQISTSAKVELFQRIVAAGVGRLEIASFVHPRLVPQMADAEAVVSGFPPQQAVSRIGLVLNRRGLDRALATDVEEINFVVGASEGFNTVNQRASVGETMASIEEMVPLAIDAGRSATVTISVAFGCPFDGEVPVAAVVGLAERSAATGAGEIALGDTIGVASPGDVSEMVASVQGAIGSSPLRCHFHDTRNTGVANVVAAVAGGVRVIDASVGGTGGCPYAPNATGNVPTEDVLYALHRMGYSTGVDLDAMIATGHWLGEQLGKELPSALGKAGNWPAS